MKKLILNFIALYISILIGSAQTITSIGSGNWNTPATWSTNAVPTISDSVVIASSHLINLDMPVSGNNQAKSVTITTGGVLEYRSSGIAILEINNVLNIENSGSLRTISGSTQIGHLLQVGGNITNAGILNIQLNKLKIAGSISGAGTIYADSISSTIETYGSSAQTINAIFNNLKIANVIFNNATSFTNSVTFSRSAKFLNGSITGTITLGNGATNAFDYERKDGTHPTITRNYNATVITTITYSNTNCTSTGSEIGTTLAKGTLIMNSPSCVTLSSAFAVQKLTMTAGILYTTSTNLLTLSDTGRYDVTRTGGWVNGPMERTLPFGMNTVDGSRVYLFPLGKSSYAGFEMVTPITRNTPAFGCFTLVNCKIKAESFDGASGGSSPFFTSLKTNRYWNYSVSANSCIFFSSGIRVYDSTASQFIAMGVANSKTGTYNNIGGFYDVTTNTLGGTQPIYPSAYSNNVYINLGGKPTLAAGTYTVGNSGRNYQSITAVSNKLHSSILTGDVIFEFYDNYTSNDEVIPFTFWPFATSGGDWNATLRPNINNTTDLVSQGDPGDPTWHAFFFSLTTFSGVRNLTIDGRKGGVGNTPAWIFRNKATTSTAPVFRFESDACKDTIKYIICEGQNINSGIIEFVNSSYSKGNDSNGVISNYIRRRTDVAAIDYTIAIRSSASSTGAKNDCNTIDGNRIENPKAGGIYITGTATGSNWNITNNHIYCPATFNNAQSPLEFSPGLSSSNNKINGNYIGGSSINATGTWNNGYNGAMTALKVSCDTAAKNQVINNTIRNFKYSGTGTSFFGINTNVGNYYVQNNTIGDATNDSSILLINGITINGILVDNNTKVSIGDNTISGILSHFSTGAGSYAGIKMTTLYTPILYNNTISNIRTTPYNPTAFAQQLFGIQFTSGTAMNNIYIAKNTISNLHINDAGNASSLVRGIYFKPTATSTGIIKNNKIIQLKNASTSTIKCEITGIFQDDGHFDTYNNQIILDNNSNTNDATIIGIYDSSSNNVNNNFYYNSIYIAGTTTSGTQNSYGLRRAITSNINIKNNLIYNIRTGGTGSHLCIANYSANIGWSATASMHNAYIGTDTSRIGQWNGIVYGNGLFRTKSISDSTSWVYNSSEVPADSLFTNKNNDLTIINSKPFCYIVNGKGTQINSFKEDFSDSLANRSTQVVTGAPDIGADEITPQSNVVPIPLVITGSHTNNGTEIFNQGGRKVVELTWGSTGTLPTLAKYYYYTGTWPNDTTNGNHGLNKRYMNSYVKIDTSNLSTGAGYSYTFKHYYDNALLGKIQSENNLILVKKQSNIASTWDTISNRIVNTFQNTVSTTNASMLNSFSEFTLTENNSFALPIIFTNYYLTSNMLTWTVQNDFLSDYYIIEKTYKNEKVNIETIEAKHQFFNQTYSFKLDEVTPESCYKIIAYSSGKEIDKTNNLCIQKPSIELFSVLDISIFPNPITDNLNLNYISESEENLTIYIYDMSGARIIEKQYNNIIGNGYINIPVKDLNAGIYTISIASKDKLINKKIVKSNSN